MKKFTFKLNKVLEVKTIELKQHQKSLSEASQKKIAAHEELEQHLAYTNNFVSRLNNVTTNNAGALQLFYDYFHRLLNEAEQKEKTVSQMEDVEKRVREKLIAIQKEQKVLEKLKEHELQKFLERFHKDEQNTLDELAVLKYSKGKQ